MKFEFSAGGIVYKRESGKVFVLVAQHSQHHGWVFPKGIIGDNHQGEKQSAFTKGFGETKEGAAVREVKEETGIIGKIVKELTPVTYWYQFEREKIKKTVYYFLMEYVSGDTKDHDFEMENVEWVPRDEVLEKLTYKSDKEVWKEAREYLTSNN